MRPRYLVLSGGGTNGFVHVGVWKTLEWWMRTTHGVDFREAIRGVAGTSAGAIVGLGVILGFTAVEFEHFASETLDSDIGGIKINLISMYEGRGMIDHRVLSDFVKAMLRNKLGHDELTFGELKTRLVGKAFACTAHNFTTLRGDVFGTETSPDLEVWRGVTMSCLLPFVFDSMEWNGCEYVDGGLSNQLPITVFPPELSIAVYIAKCPDDTRRTFISRFAKVLEAFDTSTKDRIEAHPELHTLIRVPVSVASSEHIMGTGGLRIDGKERQRQIHLGAREALREVAPWYWRVCTAVANVITAPAHNPNPD